VHFAYTMFSNDFCPRTKAIKYNIWTSCDDNGKKGVWKRFFKRSCLLCPKSYISLNFSVSSVNCLFIVTTWKRGVYFILIIQIWCFVSNVLLRRLTGKTKKERENKPSTLKVKPYGSTSVLKDCSSPLYGILRIKEWNSIIHFYSFMRTK